MFEQCTAATLIVNIVCANTFNHIDGFAHLIGSILCLNMIYIAKIKKII